MAVRRVVWTLLPATAVAAVAIFGFFYFRDNVLTHYPIKAVSARIFRAGQIPWWNFYDGGGQPLAGNPNTLTFYPDNFLYLIFPLHVAFNLHFLLHLVFAWFAMRALCRATGTSKTAANFATTMYAMSGVAISALAFYNLITAVALIPFALWAVERDRSPLIVGAIFGMIGLAGEPVILISASICALIIGWRRIVRLAIAALVALAVVSPQLIAYAEIASEVERAFGFSATTVLNASLWPIRVAEIVAGPLIGFLTDPGHPEYRGRLFSYLFVGVIVLPALFTRRRRYIAIAAVMLFFALGRYNPIFKAVVEALPSIRIARYPEKFAIALTVALSVLVAAFVDGLTTRWRVVWGVITFVPLAVCLIHGAPIDWFAPYEAAPAPPIRLCDSARIDWGTHPAREEYRFAAKTVFRIFGAVGGFRYAANRSPEGMHSLMSRVVAERVASTPDAICLHYLRICGCNVPGALPPAWIVPRAIGIHSVNEEVQRIESGHFDEHTAALAPAEFANFTSPLTAHITDYVEGLQDIHITVATPKPAMLFVNQSFFRAWDVRAGGHGLATLPLDIDRLGVIVPAGRQTIELRFGRHRTAVAVAWVVSSLLILVAAFALRVEGLDRRAGEVERAADEDVVAA